MNESVQDVLDKASEAFEEVYILRSPRITRFLDAVDDLLMAFHQIRDPKEHVQCVMNSAQDALHELHFIRDPYLAAFVDAADDLMLMLSQLRDLLETGQP